MNLSGNTVLITGGTSGIGLAFAEQFLASGSNVIICGRREDRLKQIKEKHPSIHTKVCDVSSSAQREELYSWAVKNFPDLNVFINNAGIQLAVDLTHPVNVENLTKEVTTNLIAPIHLASLFAGYLAAKKESYIINISSGLAFAPLAFMPVYCATKAAIHSITMSLRYQLRNTPVKVIEMIPPSTDTELGHERRTDKAQTHGGLPVSEFIKEAMEALKNDVLEAPVAESKNLRAKGETMFPVMNR